MTQWQCDNDETVVFDQNMNIVVVVPIIRLANGNGIPMGIPQKMSYGIGWDSTHCISHGTFGTEIDEQGIANLLNKHSDSEYEWQNDNEL